MRSGLERRDVREEGRAGGARQSRVWRVLSEEPKMHTCSKLAADKLSSLSRAALHPCPRAVGCYWQSCLDLLGSLYDQPQKLFSIRSQTACSLSTGGEFSELATGS